MKGSDFCMKKIPEVTNEEWGKVNEFNRFIYDDFFANNIELSDKSIKAYRSSLKIWFRWVMENLNNKQQTDIKGLDFKRYQNWLITLEHSSADISNKRAAVSSLNNYIMVYYESEYPTFRNFINSSIKKPEKSFVREKTPPTKSEMEMLISTLEESKVKDKYQKIAYLKFTWETGCRRAETMQILKDIITSKSIVKKKMVKLEDGTEEEKEIKYYLTPKIRCKGKGKTGKIRRLKFSDYSMEAFKKWLEERGDDDCPYMFITKYNGGINQVGETTFNNWCTDVFSPIIGRRFHPHILREGRATSIVVEEGKNIEAAQALLGHESSQTTQIYVIRDDEDEDSDELFMD